MKRPKCRVCRDTGVYTITVIDKNNGPSLKTVRCGKCCKPKKGAK